MNLLRKNIHDKRVIELVKRYLKAGVMEDGLLANIYLNEYDKEMRFRFSWSHESHGGKST